MPKVQTESEEFSITSPIRGTKSHGPATGQVSLKTGNLPCEAQQSRVDRNFGSGKGIPMSHFTDVTVVKKANVYFDGKVTSRTILLPDGSKKTLGIMMPGDYEFGTAEKEVMEILAGDLDILLPGAAEWKTVSAGEMFEVPADSKFSLRVKSLTDYCCSYIK